MTGRYVLTSCPLAETDVCLSRQDPAWRTGLCLVSHQRPCLRADSAEAQHQICMDDSREAELVLACPCRRNLFCVVSIQLSSILQKLIFNVFQPCVAEMERSDPLRRCKFHLLTFSSRRGLLMTHVRSLLSTARCQDPQGMGVTGPRRTFSKSSRRVREEEKAVDEGKEGRY